MRICHVITRLIIGGAQENTVLSCRGLVERGHEVTLIAGPETGPEGSLWDDAKRSGARLVTVPTLRRAVSLRNDVAARRDLIARFRELAPDVVHTHSSKAGILGRSAAAAAGVPVVVHTVHGMSFNRTQPAVVQLVYRLLERRAARQTSGFVSVADAMTTQCVAAGIAPAERFVTIRSGMQTDSFTPDEHTRRAVRAAWSVADDEVVVMTVARLFRNKGYEELIEALPRAVSAADNLRFVWVGDGADRTRYERALEGLGLRDRVRLEGLVPPTEVARLLNGADILAHASRWEGLPRAVVQGLLMRVPAVAFDNDGSPEVVVTGETGVLVPLGDAAGIADALIRLAGEPELRRRCGEVGRRRCLVAFDWRTMVAGLDAYYHLLSGPTGRRS